MHSDGKIYGANVASFSHLIKIRKCEPFVLDFSNRPEVMFVSPARGQTFKAGETLTVRTVLAEPVLGAIFRDLEDTTRREKRDGGDANLSLAPTVKILDSAGKTLAEGTMPFG